MRGLDAGAETMGGSDKTGADVLVERLVHHGVRCLFGMPGSHSTAIYDALARLRGHRNDPGPQRAGGGVHGRRLARVSAEPGVVCTTAGPGATNALSGVAEAWADSVPLLLLAGQVNAEISTASEAITTRSTSRRSSAP